MDNIEYKVIASNTPSFSTKEKMQKILDEEAQAGWRLVEKLDNFKIRVARDISARENDANTGIDPYRTEIGMSNILYLGGAAVITLAMLYLIIQAASLVI